MTVRVVNIISKFSSIVIDVESLKKIKDQHCSVKCDATILDFNQIQYKLNYTILKRDFGLNDCTGVQPHLHRFLVWGEHSTRSSSKENNLQTESTA